MKNRRVRIAILAGCLLAGLVEVLVIVTLSYRMEGDTLPELSERPLEPEPAVEEEPAALPPMEWFQDVTARSGVHFTCRNGEEAGHLTLLESLGGGGALFDFDRDGLLDLFLVGGGYFAGKESKEIRGSPCKLYRNLGGWRFRDVSAQTDLDRLRFYSHGCAVADYDCDGWPDLLVTGYGRLALFHNESDGKGGRKLAEVSTAAHLHDSRWNTSAAWADLDGDGYPDLYVCHYVDWSWQTHHVCPGDSLSVDEDICPPKVFRGVAHALYRNNRDGTFSDVSKQAGLRLDGPDIGMGLGVLVVDVNNDRRPDIYAVNDTTVNFLYLNESSPGTFRFKEIGLESGTALGDRGRPDGSMGVDAADYDGCGRPSLWVTTFEHERSALYHNDCSEGRVSFHYATRESGVAALGAGYVGFGTGFFDLDNDGWEDLAIANGHVRRRPSRYPLRQRALLLRNTGSGRFANVTSQGGAYFQGTHRGRGLLIGDLDNDGRPDLVISHLNDPVQLLCNAPRGKEVPHNHWLGLQLSGRANRDVAGATLVVEVGGRRLTRFARGGGTYLCSADRRIVVGLGTAERVGRVTVSWPWGGEQHWDGLTIDRYWQLVEGEPGAREAASTGPTMRKNSKVKQDVQLEPPNPRRH